MLLSQDLNLIARKYGAEALWALDELERRKRK